MSQLLQIDRAKTIPFTFDETAHAYFVEGGRRKLLSSTQILSALGYVNYEGVPAELLEHKRQIGKLIHTAAHFHDEALMQVPHGAITRMEIDAWERENILCYPHLALRYTAYLRFLRDTGYCPIINEGQFIGECYGMHYGMQFDSIGYAGTTIDGDTGQVVPNGRPWLVDIKNASGSPKRAWGLQLASYALGVKRFSIVPTEQYVRVIVQLLEDGTYKMYNSTDPASRIYTAQDFQIWPAVLATAQDLQRFNLVKELK